MKSTLPTPPPLTLTGTEIMETVQTLQQFIDWAKEQRLSLKLIHASNTNQTRLRSAIKDAQDSMRQPPKGLETYQRARKKLLQEYLGREIKPGEKFVPSGEFPEGKWEEWQNALTDLDKDHKEILDEAKAIDKENREFMDEYTKEIQPYAIRMSLLPETEDLKDDEVDFMHNVLQALNEFFIDDLDDQVLILNSEQTKKETDE